MNFRRLFTMAALAGAFMLATSSAQAGFNYSTAPTPAAQPFGASSTFQLSGVTNLTTGSAPTFINIANVIMLSSTVSPPAATDTAVIPISIPVTITNVPSPGTAASGTITVTGTITITRSDTGGELSAYTPTGGSFTNNALNIGGVVYTLSGVSYTPPTINNLNGDGNISVRIDAVVPSGIPEPSSVILLGSGLAGLVGFRLRRNKKV